MLYLSKEFITEIKGMFSGIDENTSPENVERWDSFSFYVLLNEIEKGFKIKFDIDETLEIKKVGDFKKLFQKRGIEVE